MTQQRDVYYIHSEFCESPAGLSGSFVSKRTTHAQRFHLLQKNPQKKKKKTLENQSDLEKKVGNKRLDMCSEGGNNIFL